MTSASGLTETDAGTAARPRPVVPARAPARATARAGGTATDFTAIVVATATAEGSGPAAALPWEDTTVLRRLVDQIADLGVPTVHVIARPEHVDVVRGLVSGAELHVRVHRSADPAADLRTIAGIVSATDSNLVLAQGDIVTHREALAGLLVDPRLTSGILVGRAGRPFSPPVRVTRGRVVSAGSIYHRVHRRNSSFLGVLKVGAVDRTALLEAAARLVPLAEAPPEAWDEQLRHRRGNWRVRLALAALPEDAERPAPEDAVVTAAEEAEIERRAAAGPHDVVSLLLVALVRSGLQLGHKPLRKLFWARPLSLGAARVAEAEIREYDEDQVLLESAVKANDGFFTTHFVSTYSRYIARWAARRGLTPNQVTIFSAFVGLLAAIAFATGESWGLVAGAVLLYFAFVFDCVDGQLARYTRTFSKLGAWLDSIFDRTKEYVVFAGLAIGASRSGDPVWVLATGAMILQTVRHSIDFAYGAAQHQVIAAVAQPPVEDPLDAATAARAEAADEPDPTSVEDDDEEDLAARDEEEGPPQGVAQRALGAWRALDRLPGVRWAKKMTSFPIGERFAAISLTAALFGPRTTFHVVLAWGGFALAYTVAGRTLRSLRRG